MIQILRKNIKQELCHMQIWAYTAKIAQKTRPPGHFAQKLAFFALQKCNKAHTTATPN
jgi:hypothetical protein